MKLKIMIGICILVISLVGCDSLKEYLKPCTIDFSEENPIEDCIPKECYDKCHLLDYKYFHYDSGGFGSEECWCVKTDKTTIQIY